MKKSPTPIFQCRICLAEGEIPIFGEENSNDSNISVEISTFTDIQISEDDEFPKHICDSCFQLLLGAIFLRNTAKESNKLLISTLFDVSENMNDINSLSEISDTISEIKNGVKGNNTNSTVSGTLDSDGSSEEDLINDNDKTIVLIVENLSDTDDITISDQGISHSCDLCQKNLESLEDYHNHVKTDSTIVMEKESRKNIGGVCNKLLSEENYDEHVQAHDFDKAKSPSIIECTACTILFKTMEDFEEHCNSEVHKNSVKISNSNQQKVKCTVCEKYVTKYYYKNHLLLHGGKAEKEKLLRQCPYCGKSVVYSYFNAHIQRIHSDKVGQKHVTRRNEKFEIPQYICDKCGKIFSSKRNLKQHILIHGGELRFKCIFCPYRGLHAGLLKIHIRTHTRDYNYKCWKCPAKFHTKSNLSKHQQRKHNPGSKVFQCGSCDKSFYTKPELNKHHEAIHLGIKKHTCDICGKVFNFRNYMMCHQRKVHKRKRLTNGKGRIPNYLVNEINNENHYV